MESDISNQLPEERDAIPHGVVDALVKTRPWVLLLGIVTLLGCALMVMAGLFMMLLGGISGLGGLGGLGDMGALSVAGGMALGAVYLVFAVIYLIPAIHLIRYSSAIKRMSSDPTGDSVEQALKHQLSFWRFVGIATVAIMGLYVVIILVALVMAIASA